MTSPEIERLAKWGQCEGCERWGLLQPWGPEHERICEECAAALDPVSLRSMLAVAGGTVGILGGLAWWVLG